MDEGDTDLSAEVGNKLCCFRLIAVLITLTWRSLCHLYSRDAERPQITLQREKHANRSLPLHVFPTQHFSLLQDSSNGQCSRQEIKIQAEKLPICHYCCRSLPPTFHQSLVGANSCCKTSGHTKPRRVGVNGVGAHPPPTRRGGSFCPH